MIRINIIDVSYSFYIWSEIAQNTIALLVFLFSSLLLVVYMFHDRKRTQWQKSKDYVLVQHSS